MAKILEQHIDHFVHLGAVIPFVLYFLSCLHELKDCAEHRKSVTFNKEHLSDLKLMFSSMHMAKDRIDINHIAYLKPTHTYCSDS